MTRIHSVAGTAAARASADRARRRFARRTTAPRRRRSSAAGRGCVPARRASRTAACCCSTSWRSSRGRRSRRCGSRSRTASSRSRAPPAASSFRRASSSSATMNLCPCGARGDPAAECTCSAQRLAALPGQALARAARPLRPRRRDAAAAGGRARRGAGRAVGRRGGARVVAARERLAVEHAAADGRGRRAAVARGRAAAALRARPRAGRPRGADRRGARRLPSRCSPEHLAEALAYRVAAGARRVSELALAVFASETGTHLVRAAVRRALGGARARLRRRARTSSGSRRRGSGSSRRAAADFPPLLRAIHDPPPGLFVRGAAAPELLSRPAVAVVGARACSRLRRLGRAERSRASSPPPGSSSSAASRAASTPRRTAARSKRAGRRSPCSAAASTATTRRRTRELARRIAERGLIVSEYAPGVEPAPWRFPARNRIVAGLCAATVVVEARERSGALITADLALEEGREVFAVPGEITSSLSAGTNDLLKLGASPLTRAADVLSCFGIEAEPAAAVAVEGAAAGCSSCCGRPRRAPTSSPAAPASTRARSPRALVELELAGLAAAADGVYRSSFLERAAGSGRRRSLRPRPRRRCGRGSPRRAACCRRRRGRSPRAASTCSPPPRAARRGTSRGTARRRTRPPRGRSGRGGDLRGHRPLLLERERDRRAVVCRTRSSATRRPGWRRPRPASRRYCTIIIAWFRSSTACR